MRCMTGLPMANFYCLPRAMAVGLQSGRYQPPALRPQKPQRERLLPTPTTISISLIFQGTVAGLSLTPPDSYLNEVSQYSMWFRQQAAHGYALQMANSGTTNHDGLRMGESSISSHTMRAFTTCGVSGSIQREGRHWASPFA